jgi:DNA recombination protein RmuC
MEELALVLSGLSFVLMIAVTFILLKRKNENTLFLDRQDKEDLVVSFNSNAKTISGVLQQSVDNLGKNVQIQLDNMSEKIKDNREMTEKRLELIEKKVEEKLKDIENSFERNLHKMQESNEKKLGEIQQTVDEKLAKTLNDRFKESFALLTEQLKTVSETIGEMQKMSTDVGNLSKMLSNVKTTGIFGEIQLGAIIDEILAPEQYVKNVVTNKSGRDPVEFAIKFPGGDGGEVLLPIDAKFPYTIYTAMQTAYEQSNFAEFEEKKKQLIHTIKSMAKDIQSKYVNPPVTTNFAVMFLPIEGLYCEIVKLGLIEELSSKYNVTIAGPTTMAALLNSLQMGFKTLAIQKKSNEVWTILGAVKKEFGTFGDIIDNIQKRLNLASKDLDDLVGVRTRAIQRSLKNVEVLEGSKILGLPEEE